MRHFQTLRGRLTAYALLAATAAVALLVIAFNVVLRDTLDGDANSRLRSRAAAVATTVKVEGSSVAVRESPDDAAIDSEVWIYRGSRPLVRAKATPAVQAAADAIAGQSRNYEDLPNRDFRLYVQPLTNEGKRVGSVVVGLSLAAYDRTKDFALLASIALAVILLAAVFVVTWLTIGRALGPVTEMTRSAADWSEHDVDRRFGALPRPDELGELAATFDALLDRLAASLRHERRLSSELSHELRTPLARIVAEVEMLQRRERSADDMHAAQDVIERSAAQMSRILETLMAAARADAAPERGRSDAATLLATLDQTWVDPLAEAGIELLTVEPSAPLTLGVEADVVEQIVAPLLDNARNYAREVVRVEIAPRDGRVAIEIHDDGPGVSADEQASIFEPGTRGTGSEDRPGAGLGLALARRLARAVDGDIEIAPDSAAGGATFVVQLPA